MATLEPWARFWHTWVSATFLRTYREVGYDGMIMPDHVPKIEGDPGGKKAFAYTFGYIQALLQLLRMEA